MLDVMRRLNICDSLSRSGVSSPMIAHLQNTSFPCAFLSLSLVSAFWRVPLLLNSVYVTYVYTYIIKCHYLRCCCPPDQRAQKRSTYSGPSCDIFLLFIRQQQCYLFIMTVRHRERNST